MYISHLLPFRGEWSSVWWWWYDNRRIVPHFTCIIKEFCEFTELIAGTTKHRGQRCHVARWRSWPWACKDVDLDIVRWTVVTLNAVTTHNEIASINMQHRQHFCQVINVHFRYASNCDYLYKRCQNTHKKPLLFIGVRHWKKTAAIVQPLPRVKGNTSINMKIADYCVKLQYSSILFQYFSFGEIYCTCIHQMYHGYNPTSPPNQWYREIGIWGSANP